MGHTLFWSKFADENVILPLALVVALSLALMGWRQGAKGWLIAVFGTLSTIVMAKLFFRTIRGSLPIDLLSPSAHVAAGALVYGSLLALLLRGGRAGPRTACVTSGLFAALFATARIDLGAHTMPEVIIGGIIGVTGAVTFVQIAGRMPRGFNRIRLVGACALAVLLVYGHRFSGERLIEAAANLVRETVQQAIAHPGGG